MTAARCVSLLRTLTPLLAGLLVIAVTVSLGNWQQRRALEKTELQAVLDAAALHPAAAVTASAPVGAPRDGADPGVSLGQRVLLEGEWLTSAGIFLDNRTYAGRAGYHVLTPLRLADGSGVVLVNRGWVATGADRTALPAMSVASG